MIRLKQLRKEQKVTQIELAQMLNVKQTTISNWENEITEIDQQSLFKLADYFNVSVDYFLGREASETISSPPKKHTVVSIGRGGERREYEISDEDAAIVDAFLEKMRKKD